MGASALKSCFHTICCRYVYIRILLLLYCSTSREMNTPLPMP